MKLKYLLRKSEKKLKFFVKSELSFLVFNFFLKESFLRINYRQFFFNFFILKYKRFSFFTFLKFRCVLSNRSRILNFKLKLSRQELKKNIILGKLEGFKRSSW